MTNPVKLTTQIRFHLSELGARNAHHEFEHLARHIAKARLYSNILPATGPVSAGGDGGRDFETFRTQVLALPGSKFAEESSGQRVVVFACSLEKQIEAKIRRDVTNITAEGEVDEIVYFCEANVPTGRRKRLVDETGVDLRIFDGNAISEWLAEPALFWIAEEFLHVPAELAPQPIYSEEDYTALKRSWVGRFPLAVSHADFVSIKRGLRRATSETELHPDLGFWLDKMEDFRGSAALRDLHRSAEYEIAVAHLRGRSDMTSQADLITDYFSDVAAHPRYGDLTNAATLLAYVVGAQRIGAFRVDDAVILRYRKDLEDFLRSELAQSFGPGRSAGLLFLLGMVEQLPQHGTQFNLDKAIAHWNAMMVKAADAPLYPIESFADFLIEIVRFAGDEPMLLELADRVDELLGKRLGALAAGEKAIARAISLMQRDQSVASIRELQSAKAKWMSGERMANSLHALLLLCDEYKSLGLAYAAKYHAMVATHIARFETADSVRSIESAALLKLVDLEDLAGNSFGFMQLMVVLTNAHIQLDENPLNPEHHPEIQINFGQVSALLGLLARSDPATRKVVDSIGDHWPAEMRRAIWDAAANPAGFWTQGPWSGIWADLEETMLDRPFGDLGEIREARWEALGIVWRCRFSNDYATTPSAEQWVAELQLIACAMGGRDLGIVPSEIVLEVAVDDATTSISVDEEAHDGIDFRVTLPSLDRGPNDIAESLSLFAAAIDRCSVLIAKEQLKSFDKSVLEAMFVGRPYAELYREVMPEEGFREDVRRASTPLDRERKFASKAGQRVPCFDGPGPGFDEERAQKDAENRYAKMLPSIRHTVAAANDDPTVRTLLVSMHLRGMKDWEILSILGNIALNERFPLADDTSPEATKQQWTAALERSEEPQDALPPSIFTATALRNGERMYLAAFMASWGLQFPRNAAWEAIETFLVDHMRLRDIDMPHADVFDWPDAME